MTTTTEQIIHQTHSGLLGLTVEVTLLHPAHPAIGENVTITDEDETKYRGSVVCCTTAGTYLVEIIEVL